jgi:HEAT repeat protein
VVLRAILVEGVALCILLALIYGHALWLAWFEARYQARLSGAREAITVLLDPSEMSRDEEAQKTLKAVSALGKLPLPLQIGVFKSLARNLAGQQKKKVGDLAVRAGLLTVADRGLQSRRWWKRLQAVRLLTVLDVGTASIPKLLDDANPHVRAQAAEWAGEHPRPELIRAVLKLLSDPAKICRFTAQNSLLKMGNLAVPYLSQYLLQNSRPSFPLAVEVALGLAEPRFLPAALRLCHAPSPAVRALAARLIGQMGGKEGGAALAALLRDPIAEVRAEAARSLGKLGEWPCAPALAQALCDAAWDVRRAAGLALRSLGSPGILLLRQCLSNDDKFACDMARQILEIPASALVRDMS